MPGEVSGPVKAVGREAVDVVIDYLVPIGAGLTGAVAGVSIVGGPFSIANALNWQFGSDPTGGNATRIGCLVFGAIWGAVGLAFWRLGKRDGWIERLLGKAVGAFFIGTALRCTWGGITNQVQPQGAVDALFSWISSMAGGH